MSVTRRALGTALALLLLVATTALAPARDVPDEAGGARTGDAPEARAARAAPGATPAPEQGPLPWARMPDLQVLPPDDLYVVDERPEGGSLRLKFTTVVWNAGDGPMEVWGEPDPDDASLLAVEQILYDRDGRKRPAGAVGRFDFEHRHGHLHLASFARYELWSLDGDGPDERVAANDKVGFCLMDNVVIDDAVAPEEPVYSGCEAEVQGISPGYGDEYVAQLYEQDLVIDGLPDGRYRLVNVANPDGVLREARLDNNRAHVDVALRGGTVATAGD